MGGKHTKLPMRFSISDLGYGCAMLLTVAGILAMGADNSQRLARCEASGRSAAECRLVVLGR